LHYKVRHGGRLVLMDDAWSLTDQRGRLTRWVKRLFYGFVDGGFFPDRLHGDYFATLNIPLARQRYPVDVVGPCQRAPASLKRPQASRALCVVCGAIDPAQGP
jgi:hypothetical protein